MVWQTKLVSEDGLAVIKKIWVPEPNAPKTLQELCLLDSQKRDITGGRTIYNTSRPPSTPEPQPDAIYNPVTLDYSYMRYAMSLGAHSDGCLWDESQRIPLPDLVHSRESSPASSSTSTNLLSSPSTSYSGHRFHSPSSSYSSDNEIGKLPEIDEIPMCDLRMMANLNFHLEADKLLSPSSSTSPSHEYNLSFQAVELTESFTNPFTRTASFEDHF